MQKIRQRTRVKAPELRHSKDRKHRYVKDTGEALEQGTYRKVWPFSDLRGKVMLGRMVSGGVEYQAEMEEWRK